MIRTKIAKIREAAGKAKFANESRPNDFYGVRFFQCDPDTQLDLLDYISDLEKCVGVLKESVVFYGIGTKRHESAPRVQLLWKDKYETVDHEFANSVLTTVATILGKYKDE
jgi:hypothetical protein